MRMLSDKLPELVGGLIVEPNGSLAETADKL